MTVCSILQWPDRDLAILSRMVDTFDKDLCNLARDLSDTVTGHAGLGLAAPQIGVRKCVIVVSPALIGATNPDPFHENSEIMVLVNPIIEGSEETVKWPEACLSVPMGSGSVTRSKNIKVSYQTIDGSKKSLDVGWPLSGVIQHEVDHLSGKLFLDRMSRLSRERLKKKILKNIKKLKNEYEEDQKILQSIESGYVDTGDDNDPSKVKIGRPKRHRVKSRKKYGRLKKRKK